MINFVWSGLLTLVLLSGCGFDGTTSRQNDFVPLTSVIISADTTTIAKGTSTKLKVTGNFSGLFSRDVTDQAVWSSSSTAVADFITTVTPIRVKGIAPGNAILTATVKGVSGTFALTVSNAAITSMTITPANPSIPLGRTQQFAVSGTFLDGTTPSSQDVTFDATWTSTPAPPATVSSATVSNDPASKGFATSLAEGSETITASFGSATDSTTLTVTPAVVQSITVNATNTSVLSISTVKNNFTAKGTFSDGRTNIDITSQVAWTSSNPAIATFNTTGDTLTTLAQGTPSIIATPTIPSDPGVSGTIKLNVTGGNLNSITVSSSPPTVPLVIGTVSQLTVTGIFDNGAQRDITGMAVWTPADPALATVTKAGGNLAFLNAIAQTASTTFTATVTAASGAKTASTNLTINTTTLNTGVNTNGLQITPANPDLTVGTSSRFKVNATFNDGTVQDVTASSDWTSTGGVSVGTTGLAKGLVKANATGPASITAAFGGQTVTITNPTAFTVTSRTLQSFSISSISALFPGRQVNFATTAGFNGATVDVTEDTSWAVSNSNVVIFPDSTNHPGQMVAVDSGTATVTANFVGAPAITVTVTVP